MRKKLTPLLLLSAIMASCQPDGKPAAPSERPRFSGLSESLTASCEWVPEAYVSDDEGCDCPLDGNTSCDPDCQSNGGTAWCGCDYCYDGQSDDPVQTPPPGWVDPASCEWVPEAYLSDDEGCDCPLDGDTSCDPDCQFNAGTAWCGCDYCYDGRSNDAVETPPPGWAVVAPPSSDSPSCDWVPEDYVSDDEGCDCPLDGNTSCDPDCQSNGATAWCGCDYCYDGRSDDPVETPPGSVSDASCTSTPPDAVLRGGGEVSSGASYGDGCPGAYVVDIDDYDASFNLGTWVAYRGPRPGNEAECEATTLSIAIWEHIDSELVPLFEPGQVAGRWMTDPWGQGFCQVPRFNLEMEVSGYEAGGDYRLAVGAEDSTGAQKPVAIATVDRVPPPTPLSFLLDLQQDVLSLPTFESLSSNDAFVASIRDWRDTDEAAVYCRSRALQLALIDAARGPLVATGVPADSLGDLLFSLESSHAMLCDTARSFHWETLRDHTSTSTRLLSSIVDSLANELSVDHEAALFVLDRALMYSLDALLGNCGADGNQLLDFVAGRTDAGPLGAIPAGDPGGLSMLSALLKGGCDGSSGDALGGAGDLGLPESTGAALEQCLNEVIEASDTCRGGPASQSGGSLDDVEDLGLCSEFDRECVEQNPDRMTKQEWIRYAIEGSLEVERSLKEQIQQICNYDPHSETGCLLDIPPREPEFPSTPPPYFPGPTPLDVLHDIVSPRKAPAARPVDGAFNVWDTFMLIVWYATEKQEALNEAERRAGYVHELEQQQQNTDELCESLGPYAPPECYRGPERCPDDFSGGSGGVTNPVRDGSSVEGSVRDGWNSCMCEHLGERLMPGTCETAEDRERAECERNPDGPDGAPKPECRKFDPAVDESSAADQECWYTHCGPGLMPQVSAITEQCTCGEPPQPVGTLDDACPELTVAYCLDEECLEGICSPIDNGSTPFGNEPDCQADPLRWPGSLDAMVFTAPDRIRVHSLPDERFLMFDASGQESLAALTSAQFAPSFEQLGTTLRQRLTMFGARGSGQNGAVRVLCNNAGTGLLHGVLGECPLEASLDGLMTTCEIPMDLSVLGYCLDGQFNLEYEVEAEADWVGIGPFDFVDNEIFPVNPRLPCEPPGLGDLVLRDNPTLVLASDGSAERPLFQFANGAFGELRPLVYAPERSCAESSICGSDCCESDEFCMNGQLCAENSTGTPVSSLPANWPPECMQDADCPAGTYCEDAVCVSKTFTLPPCIEEPCPSL